MRFPLMRNNILPSDLETVINLLQEPDPRLTSGSRVFEFEQAWSDWLGIKYSIFVNSGSSANLLCLAWLKTKFPHGGRVIVPPFTWSSDISSVYWMGFQPEFVDITLETLSFDEIKLKKIVDACDDIRAIFLTHAQGINGLTAEIIEFCRNREIILIEDVCESHGVRLRDGSKAGTAGRLSCFSFYYAHHMSTIEGGMVCTDDAEIYQYLRMIRSHGMLRESTDQAYKDTYIKNYPDLNPLFIFTAPGFNVRNNELGALIGLSQLQRLDQMIIKRANNFEYFLENLPYWVFTDFELYGQSNYAFNLILNDPDKERMTKLEQNLQEASIEYRRGSAGGGNQLRQPYIQYVIPGREINPSKEAPVADHIHFFGMYMGNYPDLKKEEIDHVLSVIASV